MTRLRIVFLLFVQFFLAAVAHAQDPNLAAQYFTNGEFEKAAALYEQLSDGDARSEYFFNRYIDCLINLERYDVCEKALKKQIKKTPENALLYVTYGSLFDRQSKEDLAAEQYKKAIEKMAPDYASVTRLANAFEKSSKFEFATQTYEKGAQLMKDPHRFAYNLGELYRRKGEPAKMIESYLNSMSADPTKLQIIETVLGRYLAPTDFTELQTQLYARVQTDENPDFIELLAWSFVQRKDYKSALRQFKALDKRLSENGQRIFRLSQDAEDARDYDAAIAGYDYIIAEKGQMNPFFFDAKQSVMQCRRKKITEGFAFTAADLTTLEADYESFLSQFGRGRQTASIIMQQAELEALYINNLPKAIGLLEEVKNFPGMERNLLARTKINLADFYLMNGDVWESTLLYSQVDKDFKEEQLGQEARFKNARLSYFNGDFQWAQAQFDVLRASTSKLISNDAIDLSVFIMDNLNLDTTSEAISLYSAAELLVFQNRFDEAFKKLDTLQTKFPDHSLQDDIVYLEAQIYEKKRDYETAAKRYETVAEKYKDDIRADNALYALAQLYETKLNDPEKAKNLYEKIFVNYSGSVFAVEARKRYRILRGDKMQ
ncbi:MAG: tetratricopeptide repeat protein [Bacteroidota bacterium]